jgi:hypothetical protein
VAEQFDVAAVRHFESGEYLEAGGHLDDAGYHYGISAENAVKNALRQAGLSPIRGHWADLQGKIHKAQPKIDLFAAGRRAGPLRRLAARSPGYFARWHINIRYADPRFVPVSAASLAAWKAEAANFLADFVI